MNDEYVAGAACVYVYVSFIQLVRYFQLCGIVYKQMQRRIIYFVFIRFDCNDRAMNGLHTTWRPFQIGGHKKERFMCGYVWPFKLNFSNFFDVVEVESISARQQATTT